MARELAFHTGKLGLGVGGHQGVQQLLQQSILSLSFHPPPSCFSLQVASPQPRVTLPETPLGECRGVRPPDVGHRAGSENQLHHIQDV
uniref:Rab interacting lysosomal protein like 1 n=1 Tax=Molossus molossus TaxID=27622 RepID=A0A7J8BZH3_MOLMO|nr:Rab interacting lysosomal protein like 1 [Molossus molossus]